MAVMGHGGMYDELGQVSTMLGTGYADQRHCGERIDRVRDELEALDQRLRGAVARAEKAEARVTELLKAEGQAWRDAQMWQDRALESGWGQYDDPCNAADCDSCAEHGGQ